MNKWNQVVSPKIQFGIMCFISLSVGALSAYAYLEVKNADVKSTVVYMPSSTTPPAEETEFLDPEQAEGEEIMIDPNADATTLFTIPGDCLPNVSDLHEQRNLETNESDLSATSRRVEHPSAYSFQAAEDPMNGAERFFEVSQTSAAPSSPRLVGIELYTTESITEAADSDNQGPFQGMTLQEYQEVTDAFESNQVPVSGEVQQIQCRPWISKTIQGAGEAFWLRFYDTVVDGEVIRITLIQDNTQYNGFLTGQIQDEAADELFGLFRLR